MHKSPPLASAAGGGEGEVLYSSDSRVSECVSVSSSEEENQNHSVIHSVGDGCVLLDRALCELGVFALSPPRRASAASTLAKVGCAVADLLALNGYLLSGADGDTAKARRFLAALVVDEAKLREALSGLRVYMQARPAGSEREDEGPSHVPNMPRGYAGCDCKGCVGFRGTVSATEAKKAAAEEPWDHDRQCRVAWCRVHGDRVPVAAVAREMGVSEATLGAMLDRGRVLSQSAVVVHPPTKVESDRAQGDRITEFRSRMRSDAMRQPRVRPEFDFRRMEQEQGKILAGVRERGLVNIGEVMRERHRRGALATLEADGHIQRAGDLDAAMCQAYRAAGDADERERFRLEFRAAAQAALRRPRPSVSEAQS